MHRITAGVFLATRRGGACAYGPWPSSSGIALGTGEIASVAIVMALTLIYTFEGGMAAVVWTMVLAIVGRTIIGFSALLHHVPADGQPSMWLLPLGKKAGV